MTRARPWPVLLGVLLGLIVAAAMYIALAWLGLITLSLFFEGRGHPPLPSAPNWLYVTIFFVAGPLLALIAGVTAGRWVFRSIRRT